MENSLISDAALYVVATPIGNLGDLSARAREVLERADLVVAEDTRHTGALLTHLGIKKKIISLHSHNEEKQTIQILSRLEAGEVIALVSDAGTPLISDPGFPLVRAARQAGFSVSPIPGPSALIAALSVSGLPCDRFVFEGFLPARSAARSTRLEQLLTETRTLVFYESPHRIVESLKAMDALFGGQREAVLLRELTKRFEQIHAGSLEELVRWLEADENHRRGEFVVVVAGSEQAPDSQYDADALLTTLLPYLHVKDAAAVAAKLTVKPKRELYQRALALKQALPNS